ncbi:MAG: hypothetical protein AAGA75_06175 [Cyanobacteria bacterium P01_E01_bin.6]
MVNVQQLLDSVFDQAFLALDILERSNSLENPIDGLPLQDISNAISTAQKQTYTPPKTLDRKARLNLIRNLNRLSQGQFEELVFALDPPKGILPSSAGAQGNRTKELLDWAEGPTGIGLPAVLELLTDLGMTQPLGGDNA